VQHDNATSYDVAGIQFTLPLQVFNANQGNISKARAELIEAEREVDRVALRLRDRLAEAYRGYETARGQLEIYDREILPRAKEALDLTMQTYGAGEVSYLELLTVQRTYFQTGLQRLEALRQLRVAEVEIDGLLLRGGLGE
jgi:cobalt-zinc-cadmium efflux system outer membrane protein